MMEKIDFKKRAKSLYLPKAGGFELLTVPPMLFLMIDGRGNPNTAPAYARAVSALYAVSYKLKFMSRSAPGVDYGVLPLEGLWWVPDMSQFSVDRKDDWLWTMMIRQPDWTTPAMFEAACAQVAGKVDALDRSGLRLETYDEGLSVQTLHIGPYSAEGHVIHEMHHDFMPANNLAPAGKHHEIYLGDPRKSAPEWLKTVLRQPVRRLS